MKHKRVLICILILTLLLTSGCWDKIELEQRVFITAMLIDLNEEDKENKPIGSTGAFNDDMPEKLKITFGMANPSKIQEGENAFLTRSVTSVNATKAVEKLATMTSRVPFYGQLRLVILTERLVRNKETFKEILDHIERDAVINSLAKVVIFTGNPEEAFEIDPKLEILNSVYVTGIMDNSKITSETTDMTLTELLSSIRNNDGLAAVPLLEVRPQDGRGFEINRLALIKDYSLLDYLDTRYVRTYKIMNRKFKNGKKVINYKGLEIPFVIYTMNREIWLEEGGDNLKYRVKVEVEGDIKEYSFEENLFETNTLKDIQQKIQESIKMELQESTRYFQNVIGADYLGFGDYTNKYHNSVYKKYKENWDEAFKKAEISYDVKADIRRIGPSKK